MTAQFVRNRWPRRASRDAKCDAGKEQVFQLLQCSPPLSRDALSSITGVPVRTMCRWLSNMVREGKVLRLSHGKNWNGVRYTVRGDHEDHL